MEVTTLIALAFGSQLPAPSSQLLNWPLLVRNAVVAALVVVALTWAVMPFLARNLHGWLYDGQ